MRKALQILILRTGLPSLRVPPNDVTPSFIMSIAALAAVGAFAPAAVEAGDRVVGFELGFGALHAPEFEGSDQYAASPTGTFSLNQLSFGPLNFDSTGEPTGFSVSPSFRYLAERKSAEFPILSGISDNDAAIELGLKATYDWERYRVFGQVRKGVTGHSGIAGELGADVKFALSDKTKVSFGPRVAFGDNSYMSYAFDVPGSATSLPAFDAGGGLKSIGAELRIRHALSDKTSLDGQLVWERFKGDGARSPIVQSGDRDQVRLGIMLVRKFEIRF